MLEPLDRRQRVLLNFVEPPQITCERVGFTVDRVPAQVLERVVRRVPAARGRVGGGGLLKIAEQVVDEMGKGFRNNHRSKTSREEPSSDTAELCPATDPPMVQ